MKKRRSGTLWIHGQPPKTLGPMVAEEIKTTICAGIKYDPINNQTSRAEGCPLWIVGPQERGTLEPRCPMCYRAYIVSKK